MTDAALSPPPPPSRRPPAKAAPEPEQVARGKTAQFPWLSMALDGPNPPPQDGKPLWLTPDGCGRINASRCFWKNTRRFTWEANGGRGGWVVHGYWAHKEPPYNGQAIEFEPLGWAPRNTTDD